MTHLRIVRPATAFSKDPTSLRKRPRAKAESHLAWVRTLPSLISGSRVNVEAAHIRFADPAYGKPPAPTSQKPDDRWTVPLTADLHRTGPEAQHGTNERQWWADRGIDPCSVALALWGCSGDDEHGETIIREANARAKAASGAQP